MIQQQQLLKLTLRQTSLPRTRTSRNSVAAVAQQAVDSDAADMDAFMAEPWNVDTSKTVKRSAG